MSVYFKLFTNCIIVKGANQSIIVDLQKSSFKRLNNDLYNVLLKTEYNSLESIYNEFGVINKEVLDEYFDYINELGFFCSETEIKYYPKLDLDFNLPNTISNCIIEETFDLDIINKIILDLESLRCEHLDLVFYNFLNNDLLKKIMSKTTKSIIKHISLTIKYDKTKSIDFFQELCSQNPRILKINLHSCEKEHQTKINNVFDLNYFESSLTNFNGCGKIESKYFVINKLLFTESLKHNSCLNKKISIDRNGFIRNCPSMPEHFGNIADTTLEEALNHSDFKKYWNISKDQIEVCKDCEFRYICTDCRAFKENPEDQYSKPLKCGYNPYTNEWAEWSINPLKQKAIEYYGMQELVKKDD